MLQVPGYTINETIHNGNRSLVFRATRENDQKPVILKTVTHTSNNLRDLSRYQYAYELMNSLDVQGIIRPYDILEVDKKPVLVMEDIGGHSLETLIKQTKVPLAKALKLAIHWADVLGKLHHEQIIHKDIKPANFIVNESMEKMQLIDFDLSTRLTKEMPELLAANKLQGTLSYISPEQTGRMNCAIDHRTDLYSLGVSLYELFTGKLPFPEQDPLALIHAHIALPPIAPHELSPDLPTPIAEIILKLLSKNPDDRYQSASGLKKDLEHCLEALTQHNNIAPFPLGAEDISPILKLPQRLYGRDNELEELFELMEKIDEGQTRLLLVSGYSGIGKSSFVREVHRPLSRAHGRFITGKYDQFQNIPYNGLIQAFRQCCLDILSESDDVLQETKKQLTEKLGAAGQVLIDVIPELALLIGPQEPAPPLPPAEAQNRFHRLFQKFVQSFATQQRPLVLFLDDLQWASSNTFELIKKLLLDEQTQHLLIIGAYRDNEVDTVHPLSKARDDLQQAEFPLHEVALKPLSPHSVRSWIADALHVDEEKVTPLADSVYERTKGNPFFVETYLKTLYNDSFLYLDPATNQWVWDDEKIAKTGITENVAALMTRQLKGCTAETQNLLHISSCVGATFALKTLCEITQKDASTIAKQLWEAIQKQLIIPIGENYRLVEIAEAQEGGKGAHLDVSYRFIHDRVQQSAYELLEETERQQTHATIGQHLLDLYGKEADDEHLFPIVNQLNLGRTLLKESADKQAVARLNLRAGLKAMKSTAYSPAQKYFSAGVELFPSASWESEHDLGFQLLRNKADAAMMCGDFDTTKETIDVALSHAQSKAEQVAICELQLRLYPLLSDYAKSGEVGLQCLTLFGFEIPEDMDGWTAAAGQEATALADALGDRSIDSLLDLPAMEDEDTILQMNVLTGLAPIASVTPHLFPVLITRMVRLSVQHGNYINSPVGYVFYGFLNCAMGNYKIADDYGRLAIALNDKQGVAAVRPPLDHLYGCFISHWRHPLDLSHEHTTKAINEGMELGVFSNAGWATMNIPWQAFSRGTELPSILQETETFLDLARNTFKYDDAVSIFLISQHITLDLMGAESLKAQLLSQGHIEEDLFAALSHYPMALFPLYTIKLQAASIMDDNEKLEQALEKAQELVPLAPGLPQQVDFVFYHSLHMTKQFLDADEETQASYNEQLNEALTKLQNWAENSPANHQYKALLVEAEMLSNQLQQETSNAAIEQRAAELYEQAIEHSQTHNILHGEGLCLERAARFYTLRKKSRTALGYLTDARHAYARWGARKKVLQMERVNPVLRVQQSQLSSTLRSMNFDSTTSSTSDRTSEMRGLLDLRSIQKTVQAISGEMKLEELLRKLLSTALENAGAQRGCLLLKDRLSLRVEASLDLETKEESILQAIPLHQASLPGSIIRFVERSRERLVLSDVTKHPRFGDDAYVKEHKTRSALCTPITHKNKLIGLLYLENNAIANVFHEERCLFLDIVAGQAAISIENAKLYGQLEDKVEERTKKLQDTLEQLEEQHNQLQSTQAQLIQVEKMSSLGTLVAGVAHELNNPANFTLNGAQNLARRLQKLKEFIFELAGDDADQEIIDSFEEKFTPLFKNLDAIANGAERIRSIVGGLRTFSRLDEAEQKRSHIIEGIKATIELVRANFSEQVTFEQHFEADPAIDCWPAQLNQVFMNLMVNACQAIIAKKEKMETDEQGRLKISTQEDDGRLAIRIQDNGSGMSKSVKEKIFEPFFTTRGVGEGTGLGLSISFGIIENHRGEIKVDSTPGIGTTFTIYLPISK